MPGPLVEDPTVWHVRVLEAFTRWFCSRGGVWQTSIFTLAVVAVEMADRGLDPHAFMLMAVLTVYSAVTQPALAHAGSVAADKHEAILARIEAAEKAIMEGLANAEKPPA